MNLAPGAVIAYAGPVPPQLIDELRQEALINAHVTSLANAQQDYLAYVNAALVNTVGALGKVTQEEATEAFLGPERTAWHELIMPWEIPPRWRWIKHDRWVSRHIRIHKLEQQLWSSTRMWQGLP